jgi:hypothetical protein
VSKSSDIAAAAGAKRVRLALFEEFGLNNSFAIGLSRPAQLRLILPPFTSLLC